jgi:hypothetical protein
MEIASPVSSVAYMDFDVHHAPVLAKAQAPVPSTPQKEKDGDDSEVEPNPETANTTDTKQTKVVPIPPMAQPQRSTPTTAKPSIGRVAHPQRKSGGAVVVPRSLVTNPGRVFPANSRLQTSTPVLEPRNRHQTFTSPQPRPTSPPNDGRQQQPQLSREARIAARALELVAEENEARAQARALMASASVAPKATRQTAVNRHKSTHDGSVGVSSKCRCGSCNERKPPCSSPCSPCAPCSRPGPCECDRCCIPPPPCPPAWRRRELWGCLPSCYPTVGFSTIPCLTSSPLNTYCGTGIGSVGSCGYGPYGYGGCGVGFGYASPLGLPTTTTTGVSTETVCNVGGVNGLGAGCFTVAKPTVTTCSPLGCTTLQGAPNLTSITDSGFSRCGPAWF